MGSSMLWDDACVILGSFTKYWAWRSGWCDLNSSLRLRLDQSRFLALELTSFQPVSIKLENQFGIIDDLNDHSLSSPQSRQSSCSQLEAVDLWALWFCVTESRARDAKKAKGKGLASWQEDPTRNTERTWIKLMNKTASTFALEVSLSWEKCICEKPVLPVKKLLVWGAGSNILLENCGCYSISAH